VLVTASDRLISSNFNGVIRQRPTRRRRSVRNQNHLKFPLFTDSQIGFGLDNPIVSAHNLISSNADEDYETDEDIMKKTIAVCKRDALFALKKVQASPNTFHEKLHNWKF